MVEQTVSGTFEIGRVIQRTFGAIGRNFFVFFGLSLLLAGLPYLAVNWAQTNPGSLTASLVAVGGFLVSLVTTYVLQAALVHGTVADLNGRRASFDQALKVGGRTFLPVLGISLLFAIAVGLGVLLLIVPGIIMLIVWMVAIPAAVVERTGVFGAFSRSRNLTRGSRWKLFGLLVIYLLIAFALLAVYGVLGFALTPTPDAPLTPVGAAAMALIQAFSAMIGAVGVASVYYELRSAKEGLAPDSLAAVFD